MRLLVLLFTLTSCFSDTPPNYSNQEFMEMAQRGQKEKIKIITAGLGEYVVNCNDYTPRCRYGYRVVVKNIEMVALFYEDQKVALEAAKRIRGYIARNWVLDEVRGEPVLERFVTKWLDAKKAF